MDDFLAHFWGLKCSDPNCSWGGQSLVQASGSLLFFVTVCSICWDSVVYKTKSSYSKVIFQIKDTLFQMLYSDRSFHSDSSDTNIIFLCQLEQKLWIFESWIFAFVFTPHYKLLILPSSRSCKIKMYVPLN